MGGEAEQEAVGTVEARAGQRQVAADPARQPRQIPAAADDYEEILAALEADGSEWADAALATLRCRSPQACKVSLRLLYDGSLMQDFADEMRQEYALATRVVQRPDFVEGVRALLVDKDNQPAWDPPTPDAVTDRMLDRMFAPMPPGEEWTPLR